FTSRRRHESLQGDVSSDVCSSDLHCVDPMVPEVDDMTEGFGVEIVADEDADLVAPDFSGGSMASADIGIVDHIVMEQGGGMNELHQTGELVMIATGIAAETGGEQ